MALLRKGERDQTKAAERARAEAEAEEAALNEIAAEAKRAKEAGHPYHEVVFALSQTVRTASGVLSGDPHATKTKIKGPERALAAIEAEGWRLKQAGYVWRQTGSVSRDKMMSSGQVEVATGEIIGVYLFQRA